MICGICGEHGPLERNGNHASCNAAVRKAARIQPTDNGKAINSRSAKGKEVDKRYFAKLRIWKKGKKCCASFKHDCTGDVTAHHMHGRSDNTYFDEWAQEHDIVLTLDERFWMPLCSEAHRIVTEDSVFAWKHGYSFKRITDEIFIKR
jgi:hypothetical protein